MPHALKHRGSAHGRAVPIACLLWLLMPVFALASPQKIPPSRSTLDDASAITLETAINLALQANRNLVSDRYNVENVQLSRLNAETEFDFKVKPATQVGVNNENKRVGVGVTLEKKFTSGMTASILPNVVWGDPEHSGQVGLSVTIPLFKGRGRGVNLDGIESAKFTLRKSQRSLFTSQVNLVVETVAAVYGVRKQEELHKLATSQIQDLEYHAASARTKEHVGLATPIDVYRAEIRLKDAQENLNNSRQALTNAKDRLKILLALPVENPIDVEAPVEYRLVSMDDHTAITAALKNRIEIEQNEDEIREATRKSLVSDHNQLPQLDLIVDYGRFSNSAVFTDAVRLDDDRWSVSLGSNTDLFRTSERLAYRQSLISLKQARLNYKIRSEEIKRDVRRQIEALDSVERRIEIKKEQIHQAEGKLELSKIKFAHAMADNFDVIEAETELQRAQSDLISAKIDYIIGTYRLRAAFGTLLDKESL